jgi:hypothetical protein
MRRFKFFLPGAMQVLGNELRPDGIESAASRVQRRQGSSLCAVVSTPGAGAILAELRMHQSAKRGLVMKRRVRCDSSRSVCECHLDRPFSGSRARTCAALAFRAPGAIPPTNIPSQHSRRISGSVRKGRIGSILIGQRRLGQKHAAPVKGAAGFWTEARSADLQ